MNAADVLQVRKLSVYFHTDHGAVKAVNDITFSLKAGERFGLVGESGSGKTTTALALMRHIKPPGRIEGGEVLLDGQKDVMKLSEEEVRRLRLAEIALIFQGSMNSLNPVTRVRGQVIDGMKYHGVSMPKKEWNARVSDLLERVGLEPEVAGMYPHQLSGGMKQRVCIAIGISLEPKLIIADEPTSALDVVVQMQVMETLLRAQEEVGAAILLVGHDMGLMAQFVERLGVMYAGKMVEIAPVVDIFDKPLHPYTRLLIESLPSLEEKGVMQGVPGMTPSLIDLPPGCAFHPRCPDAGDECRGDEPPDWVEVQPGRWIACCH